MAQYTFDLRTDRRSFFWWNLRFIPANILPMFFALSGFLVAGSWERTQNLPQFFGYRAVRLLPALAVEVLLSALILGPLLTSVSLTEYFRHPEFGIYFFNILGVPQYSLPGMFTANPFPNTVNITLWTLPFELECYLLLAILGVIGFRGKRKFWLLVGFAIWVLASTVFERHTALQAARPPGRVLVGAFASGLLLYMYRDRIHLSKTLFCCSAILGLALSSRAQLALLSLPFVAYCTTYLGMLDPPRRTFLLKGDYSYGLYLFGFPLQQCYSYLFPAHLHWWLNACFAIGFGLIYAAFSWHSIEKPILARRNQIIAKIVSLPRLLL